MTVDYKGTRDLNGYLWQSIAENNMPDVAGLPGPGQMAEFARHGSLKDLTSVIDVSGYKSDTVPTFIDLGTVDGKLVGVFIKATLKGLIWFNPHNWTVPTPDNWVELGRTRTSPAGLSRRRGASASGSEATQRLAGHGLDRGHRAAPERS